MYVKVSSPNEASNLSNLLKDGDWMVLYYADWCGHCQTMKPEWQKVVNKMKNTNIVNVAEVESNHINSLINKPQVNGFPTIKMYNSGIEKANFEEERVADKMEKFAMSNATHSMKKHKPLPMVKKISHNYINPMKKIVKSILSRKSKTMKKPQQAKPMKKRMSSKPQQPILMKQIMPSKPTKPRMPSKRKTPTKPRMPSKRKTPTKPRMPTKRRMPSKTKSKKSFRNSTKDVYSQLIKSFNRIGKEAKKDSKLLKNAVEII